MSVLPPKAKDILDVPQEIAEELDRVYGWEASYLIPPVTTHRPPLGDNMVVLPKHYSRFQFEPVHFTVANRLDLLEANVVKYTLRAPYKHQDKGKQDYMKAIRCLVMKAKFELGDPDWWKPYTTDIEANLQKELSYDASIQER